MALVKYRPDIDGLRAVAILPVVLYHAGFPGITGGYVGVDVFFVISGFLITLLFLNELNTSAILNFLKSDVSDGSRIFIELDLFTEISGAT